MAAGKKLLVPIDGSANSLRALAFVIQRVAADKSMSKEALTRARRVLAKHRVAADIVVRIGEPAESIVKFAAQEHRGPVPVTVVP